MRYTKPPLTLIPDINKYPDWHEPFSINNHKVFSIIAILKYLLNIVERAVVKNYVTFYMLSYIKSEV